MAASNATANATWSAVCSRTASRITIVCMRPMVIPRPMDGFVHEWASAMVSRPVATGVPSTTKRRERSTTPLIVAMSLIGSPSSQWA